MVSMHQHGEWWSGNTDTWMKVSISDRLFRTILARQEATCRDHPSYYSRDMQKYGVSPVCRSPQWWVDVFLDHDYAIGMQSHTWERRRGYAKLVLGEVLHPEFNPSDIRPPGTLIFRSN